MIYFDHLRPPPPFDPWAAGYKDWLHLNILDHASGSVGLVNLSLHGAPDDPRARAIGAALVHTPSRVWVGNMEVRSFREAAIGRSSIGLERTALALDLQSGTLLGSVEDRMHGLSLRVTATPAASPIVVEERLPFGRGWISWRALPRLTVNGEWTIEGERADLRDASAYHDHNWGRWHWGDDVGWEWGCFLQPAPGAAIVLSRTTDRAHRSTDPPSLAVQVGNRRRVFPGPSIELRYDGELETISRRLPGALAALHQDYARLRLPRRLLIQAGDGIDRLTVEFIGREAAQLIAGDPIVRGYGFINEIAGEFTCAGKIGDLEISGSGLGVLEHVC
jgi:hypothetical protein